MNYRLIVIASVAIKRRLKFKRGVRFDAYQISKYSPAYLVGQLELIKVKLTKKGKQSYQSRLYSRPEKIESLSSDDVYVFDCTQQQVFNYFFSFGADAEIISPEYLRNRFKNTHIKALNKYQ